MEDFDLSDPEQAAIWKTTQILLNAAPFASEPCFQAIREHKKVNAGAQFFQTNLVYNPDGMEVWLNELAKRNILDKVYILVGITPIKSYKIARYMNDEVPGVFIPNALMKRMEKAEEAGNAQEEGVQIALEIIEKVKAKRGQGIRSTDLPHPVVRQGAGRGPERLPARIGHLSHYAHLAGGSQSARAGKISRLAAFLCPGWGLLCLFFLAYRQKDHALMPIPPTGHLFRMRGRQPGQIGCCQGF